MTRSLALALAGAVLALSACGGGSEEQGAGNGATAGSNGGRAQGAAAGAGAWIVGRWGEGGDCNDVIEFRNDGQAIIEGDRGTWSLSGETLTVAANGQSESIIARQTGDGQLSLVMSSRTETFTRC